MTLQYRPIAHQDLIGTLRDRFDAEIFVHHWDTPPPSVEDCCDAVWPRVADIRLPNGRRGLVLYENSRYLHGLMAQHALLEGSLKIEMKAFWKAYQEWSKEHPRV